MTAQPTPTPTPAVAPDDPVDGRPFAQVELAIEGMTCASCVARVEKRLNRVDGVAATVNLPLESAHVVLAADVTDADLVAAVEKAGYAARVTARRDLAPDQGSPSADPGSPSADQGPASARGGTTAEAVGAVSEAKGAEAVRSRAPNPLPPTAAPCCDSGCASRRCSRSRSSRSR